MKINDQGAILKDMQSRIVTDSKRPDGSSKVNFQSQLQAANKNDIVSYLNNLAQQINQQGDLVVKSMNLKETQKYKQLISEFMNTMVSSNLSFSKSDTFDARGRHKIYAVVKTVNKELDALTQEVLKGEQQKLSILAKVDSIKGIIINLLL